MLGRLGVLLAITALLAAAFCSVGGPAAVAAGRRLPSYLSLSPHVHQLVTVTSPRWSSTRGTLRAVRWLRPGARPRIVMGPRRWVERRF